MRRPLIVGVGLAGLFIAAVLLWYLGGMRVAVSRMFNGPRDQQPTGGTLAELASESRRVAIDGRQGGSVPVLLPRDHRVPRDEQELAEFVAWMRSLGHEELLRLSNAEFNFQKSELVELLQDLQGEWVVPALGGLAVAENDPLLRAILVEGLVGSPNLDRADDQRMLPILDSLMTRMGRAAEDPYKVANGLATCAYIACTRGQQDYVLLMSAHLAASDNPALLTHGYLFMGVRPGGEMMLKQVLSSHASPAGRLGALEGLRKAATDGRIPPEEITTLGMTALDTETNEGNRLLLYEMMISTGGEDALTVVEGMLRSGEVSGIGQTVELLAVKMEPARAQALFQDLLRHHELGGDDRQALYNAMGLSQGAEGVDFLLNLARDGELEIAERVAGLKGLWNRPVDERLAGELRDVFDQSEDSALRIESLRMLLYGESEGRGLDLRRIASLDEDAAVRAEAIQLAATRPSADTREWLEERLFQDDSLDVKAAALGALVYQAHYTGDGDKVLGYLDRARKFTDDEEALAMIAKGERMVKDHDSRNLELGLAEEAEFWGTVAKFADGPAARSFQRQARQLEQIVTALRATRDGRRSAR